MDTKGVETILPLPQYNKLMNGKEVEEKASFLEAIRVMEMAFSIIGLIGCFYHDEWVVERHYTSHDVYWGNPSIGRVCVLLFGTIIFGIAQYLVYVSKQRIGLDILCMKNKIDVDGKDKVKLLKLKKIV
uniref:Microsomal glutathione S-transferase 2 n=1 Tax=Acrobeloides nanus TaxID=290746 RepID=A0A914EG96_9BILA